MARLYDRNVCDGIDRGIKHRERERESGKRRKRRKRERREKTHM